jgi:hypothetical protein
MALLVPTVLSCFRGHLVRRDVNRWLWSDGTHERRVHEIATGLWNVPQRPYAAASASACVELPYAHAQAYDPLAWVVTACRDGRYEIDVSSFFPGQFRQAMGAAANGAGGAACNVSSGEGVTVALVPVEEWKSWRALCACVPLWNTADEAALFARARELGWSKPA